MGVRCCVHNDPESAVWSLGLPSKLRSRTVGSFNVPVEPTSRVASPNGYGLTEDACNTCATCATCALTIRARAAMLVAMALGDEPRRTPNTLEDASSSDSAARGASARCAGPSASQCGTDTALDGVGVTAARHRTPLTP